MFCHPGKAQSSHPRIGLVSDMSLPCSSPMHVPLPRAALEHQQGLPEPSLCLGVLDRHCHPPEAFSLLQTP